MAIKPTEALLRSIVSHNSDGVVIVDKAGSILYANPAAETMLGRKELTGKAMGVPIPETGTLHEPSVREVEISSGESTEQIAHWVEITFTEMTLEDEPVFLATLHDVTERKQIEKMQTALYQISQATNTTDNLDELYRSIHTIMGELMPVDNFFIALYDDEKNLINFPYFVDEYDSPPSPLIARRGLTEYVLRTGKPLLAPEDIFNKLVEQGEVESLGAPSIDWLGVPLRINDQTIGAMVVQTYKESVRLGVRELNFMNFVSEQVAMAINHKQSQQALQENEQKLRASEQSYRSLVESTSDFIWQVNTKFRYTYVSPQVKDLLGYSPEEMLDETPFDTMIPNEAVRVQHIYSIAVQQRSRLSFVENTRIHKEGHLVVLETNGVPVFNENGSLVGYQGVDREITERKKTGQITLIQRDLAMALNADINLEDACHLVTDAALEIAGINNGGVYLVDLVTGALDLKYYQGASDESTRNILHYDADTTIARLVKQGEAVFNLNQKFDAQPETIDTSAPRTIIVVPVHSQKQVVACLKLESFTSEEIPPSVRNALEGIALQFGDIIMRLKTMEQLRFSEERHRAISELTSDFAYMLSVTPEGKFKQEWMIGALAQMTGYTVEEIDAQGGLLDILLPEDKNKFSGKVPLLLTGQQISEELRIRTKSGNVRWLLATHYPKWDAEHKHVIHVYGAIQDITQRRQAEEALQQSEQRFHGYFELPLIGIAITSPDKKWIEVNDKLCDLLGYSREELMQKTWADITPKEDLPAELVRYDQVLEGKKENDLLEKRYIRKDGKIIQVETSTAAVRKADGSVDYFVALVQDITERKMHERELHAVSDLSALLRTVNTHFEMIPLILDQLLNLLVAQGAVLMLLSPIGNELVTELGRGEWSDFTGMRLPSSKGLSGEVLSSGNIFVTDAISQEYDRIPPGIRDFGSYAAVCATLSVKEQPIGLIWLGRQTSLTEHEVRLVTAIADIAANAIHRSMLHEQTEQRLQHLNSLHRIDLAITSSHNLDTTLEVLIDQAITQLKVDAAAILELDEDDQILKYRGGRGFRSDDTKNSAVRLGEGFAGRAALERRTIGLPLLSQTESKFTRELLPPLEGFVSYYGTPLVAGGTLRGILEVFSRKPLKVDTEWIEFLEMMAGQAAIAIDSSTIFKNLQNANMELMLAYEETIEGWAKALELRDLETEGHSHRVKDYAVKLGAAVGVQGEDLVFLRFGAVLHDIGKMGIPDNILLKPGPLTEDEFSIMREHPLKAYDMLSNIDFLRPALEIPYCHHEHWDGSGYPRGLKGDEIPLLARIVTVVEVWDALTNDRPYRPAWSYEQARDYLQEQAGHIFDPYIVGVFQENIPQDTDTK